VALERNADLPPVRRCELRHPVVVQREDGVPEEDLAHPAARLPVSQLGTQVLNRTPPDWFLARVLFRKCAVLAKAAAKGAATPRHDIELVFKCRHRCVEALLVGPWQRIEIGKQRPHAIAYRFPVALEGAVRNIGAAEATAFDAFSQVDERPLA